ncbi:CpaD family pilus assembly protein [Phenylobacterium sp.]|uniref:CpaD family pilus assembly protein n=1 Tax=Phenylobacterium sp. TaxID=1871053 RepID=UPI00272FC13D|nr:CpaD family pilus assembly protein [Phenylobacterium sp.]MDP1617150.1 CpaD family pilus assembly protein [Phenylobacterium sp.]MDP1989040.1 CpaD family pilus assembly protein [Phenylobacterium sp.]
MTRTLRCFMPLALAAGLAACASAPPRDGAVANPATPLDQYRVQVTPRPEEVLLAIHAQGLSGPQADALLGLLAGWRAADGGAIRIQAPASGVDSAAAYRMGESVRAFLISHGAPPAAVQVIGYDAGGHLRPPMIVGYLRYEAQIPDCGESWDNLSSNWNNRVSANFGCAVTANLAAQIANPADLAGPRAMDAPDAARRADVLAKYREGAITSSESDDRSTGVVSQVVR